MKRIVVLISGRGSNLQALVEHQRTHGWPGRVVAVVSNRPNAGGLAYAQAQGIAQEVVPHVAHADRAAFDAALRQAVDRHNPDLLVLAGFMRILGNDFVQHYAGRMLNIHPSLLPAFAGLHTHQRALDAGCHVAGATVHFVTPTLDHGPIVAQAAVPVLAGDTAESLSARVLQAEHHIYPLAVQWFVQGHLAPDGEHRVRHRQGAAQWYLAPADASP